MSLYDPTRTLGQFCRDEVDYGAGSPAFGLIDFTNRWLAGGGDGEGVAAYGYGSIANNIASFMAMRSLGTDWAALPYSWTYPEDQAKWLLMGSKPDRVSMDEQEYVYFSNSQNPNPTRFDPRTFGLVLWANRKLNTPTYRYLRALLPYYEAQMGAPLAEFERMLAYDPHGPSADPTTLPLSYRSWGGNFLTARSSWNSNAVEVQFQGGPTVGAGGGGHTQFEQGSLAIWNGALPLVTYALGEVARSADLITKADDGALINERIKYNNHKVSVFVADGKPISYLTPVQGYGAITPPGQVPSVTSHPSHSDVVEDTGSYVYARAVGLESNYPALGSDKKVHEMSWRRHVLFVRPRLTFVYDQTKTLAPSDDRLLYWQMGRGLSRTSTKSGLMQFHVNRTAPAFGATGFAGALTVALPLRARTEVVNHAAVGVHAFITSIRPDPADASKTEIAYSGEGGQQPGVTYTLDTAHPLNIVGAAGAGCEGLNGLWDYATLHLSVTPATVGNIPFDSRGCTYTARSATLPLNVLYRIAVRPPINDHTDDAFLTVIDAATAAENVEEVTTLSADNADAVQAGPYVAVFALGATTQSSVTYIFRSTNGTTTHYVTNLTGSTMYSIEQPDSAHVRLTRDGSAGSRVLSSAAGVIRFQVTGGGDATTAPSAPVNLRIVSSSG